MDVDDIEIVVQYKATCNLCTLWQRFGRAARGWGQEAVAILLVEKKDTSEERMAKEVRDAKKTAKKSAEIVNAGDKRKPAKKTIPAKWPFSAVDTYTEEAETPNLPESATASA
ncbi:hypothetical protein C0991_008516, partial [Blastosporella zonata]